MNIFLEPILMPFWINIVYKNLYAPVSSISLEEKKKTYMYSISLECL